MAPGPADHPSVLRCQDQAAEAVDEGLAVAGEETNSTITNARHPIPDLTLIPVPVPARVPGKEMHPVRRLTSADTFGPGTEMRPAVRVEEVQEVAGEVGAFCLRRWGRTVENIDRCGSGICV